MPVLLAFPSWSEWHWKYQSTYRRILIDSGAYSEFTTGKKIDLVAYAEWAMKWVGNADAIAGLDDISGDWRRSMANYERFPLGFPTFHESDPPELLDDLIPMSRARGGWIGLGLLPETRKQRRGEGWIRNALSRIPDDLHVHGWAARGYTHIRRLDSVDSSNWFRDAMKLRTLRELDHLTYGECLEIIVKRYQRETRTIRDAAMTPLFEGQD